MIFLPWHVTHESCLLEGFLHYFRYCSQFIFFYLFVYHVYLKGTVTCDDLFVHLILAVKIINDMKFDWF